MNRYLNRVDKAGVAVGPQQIFLHVLPGDAEADVIAAYEREHGKIPAGAEVIVIFHSFKSAI